jgi:hypothetical protein
MSRQTASASCLVLLILAPIVSAAPLGGAEDSRAARVRQVHTKLEQLVTVDGFEANTPLKEALGFLSERFDLTILIDTTAFKDELQIMEPENQPVKLPKLVNVPLRTVLRRTLEQGSADYHVDADGIVEVLPANAVLKKMIARRVRVSYEKKPLHEALRELAADGGVSIILDERRAGDKAKHPVSADLKNLTFEAAVTLLADLAELKVVQMDRALYVTTVENARTVRMEQERKQREDAKDKQREDEKDQKEK